MTSPDVRVPPLDPGTPCTLDGREVRAYARIWPGEHWRDEYDCRAPGLRVVATREQLQVIGGVR